MDLDFQKHLPADFDGLSKVWIYQSTRPFFTNELLEIEQMLHGFVKSWTSHGASVRGFARIFFERFIVLMADETSTGVSGCSTDSSVKLIKTIEAKYQVQLLDRLALAFIIHEKIELIPFSQFSSALENNFINEETLYFNNAITNKKSLEQNWIIPLKQSWLAKHSIQKA